MIQRTDARASLGDLSVAWQLDAALGEGPIWIAEEQALRFVDIKRGRLHRFVPATGSCETLDVGGMPSFIVPDCRGSFVVGSENSLCLLKGEQLEAVAKIPEPSGNRTNDGCVDGSGRLWFGTMDNAEAAPSGAIWCWDGASLTPAGPVAVVTNGPAASVGDRWLYHVDSGERTIWRSPLGPAPELATSEVFVRLSASDGYPDGIVVDSEDCLWVALWDGWCVRRYSPEGELLMQVDFPCARVTKLAFGGPDLTTAYVTTARVGLPEEALANQPLAGSLFSFTAPAPGLPAHPVSTLSASTREGQTR